MDVGDLHFKSIAEAAAAIEGRELSPVDLVQAALGRIEQLEGRLNASITVLADQARRDARAAEAAIAAGRYR